MSHGPIFQRVFLLEAALDTAAPGAPGASNGDLKQFVKTVAG